MKLQNPLSLCVIVSAVIFTATPQMKAADPTDQCPRFQLNPLDAYKDRMKYSFLTPGSGNPKTDTFTSVCSSFWQPPNAKQPSPNAKLTWSIAVSKKDDPKPILELAQGFRSAR